MLVTVEDIKTLRDMTGAGIMDSKRALEESGGDVEMAQQILKDKGIATAAKKASRETNEGLIHSYIHTGSRVGAIVEVNCETDFVANTPDFQELVRDIAMHIAAAKPRFATREEVTQEILNKEKEIFAHQAKESGKPDNIIEKIVSGKMEKFYEENCVLEQPFIKDTNITVQELIKQKIALLGENINIGRFVRFEV